jgi:hypothetical protein
MTLEQLKSLSNERLIEIYKFVVEVDHYDPYVTPKLYNDLYDSGITQKLLAELILERMK